MLAGGDRAVIALMRNALKSESVAVCFEIGKKNGAYQLAAVFFVYRSDFSHVESRFAILLLSFLSWLLDGFDIVHFSSTVFFMLT